MALIELFNKGKYKDTNLSSQWNRGVQVDQGFLKMKVTSAGLCSWSPVKGREEVMVGEQKDRVGETHRNS